MMGLSGKHRLNAMFLCGEFIRGGNDDAMTQFDPDTNMLQAMACMPPREPPTTARHFW